VNLRSCSYRFWKNYSKKIVVFGCIHVTALMMDLVTVRRLRGGFQPMITIDTCPAEYQTTGQTP
jgi:hypothetical protein